jgi:hypothetical protein
MILFFLVFFTVQIPVIFLGAVTLTVSAQIVLQEGKKIAYFLEIIYMPFISRKKGPVAAQTSLATFLQTGIVLG